MCHGPWRSSVECASEPTRAWAFQLLIKNCDHVAPFGSSESWGGAGGGVSWDTALLPALCSPLALSTREGVGRRR